jgi:hypothetical protein
MHAIMWKLHDAFRAEAEASGGIAEDIAKDVALGEMFTHNALMDRIDTMSIRETLDYALNMVHEPSIVVYLQHQAKSRTLRKGVRETASAAIGVYVNTNLTRLGEDQGGRLPRKRGTAVA